jgi:hypothetical protein
MSDKKLAKKVDRIEEKVDRGALITDMTTKLKTASDRWAEVCRIYDEAWGAAYNTYADVLGRIEKRKQVREQAAADKLKLCLELASVILPIVGKPAAIALAPILTARGKLLANTLERKAQAAWSEFATSRPIVSKVVKEIGTRAASAAQDAATKIKDDIIKKLEPKYVVERVLAANTQPLTAFKDNHKLIQGEMNLWVQSCSEWNVKDRWERELVPVAHELFLNHPWIKTAPPEQETQNMRAPLTLFIEMALWLRWARALDMFYWRDLHIWYLDKYSRLSTRDGKRAAVRNNRRLVIDALDYSDLWVHLRWQLGRNVWVFDKMTLEDPEAGIGGGERETINLYTMSEKVDPWVSPSFSTHFLMRLLPRERIDPELLQALAEM